MMIQKIIAWCGENWLLTLIAITLATFLGYHSLIHSSLDALPDLSETQVIVYTQWEGQSPDLVEDQITYPLAALFLSAPKVSYVRGQSMEGYSFIYVIFEENTDIYWARSRVLEYLNTAQAKLPQNVQPTLGPDATGIGWVYQYALRDTGGMHDLSELRSIQDFNLRYVLASVNGVAEIASIGGYEKEYQVDIDSNKLAALNIPLTRVIDAVRDSNQEVGGRVLEISGMRQVIRGRGYLHSIEDLKKTVLAADKENIPITLNQVATVHLGPAYQVGQADLNGEGVTVGGIVIMRYGENALHVIEGIKQKIEEFKKNLPKGIEIVPVYDRSELINRAVNTLNHTLMKEIAIVSLVIIVFLLHAPSALVVIITLPIAVLLGFIPMYYQNLTANIMSLGGIAVAIGAMVDGAIAMIENVHRHLGQWQGSAEKNATRTQVIIDALQEVGPSIFFALLIITVSFTPIFALQGMEGRLFKPLAFTKSYAMFFAALLSITLIPALAVLVIKGYIPSKQDWLNQWLITGYAFIVREIVKLRWIIISIAGISLIAIVPLSQSLDTEFMPPLNEGAILYMPTSVPGMSMQVATQTLQTMDRMLSQFPEVEQVFGKTGRSTSPTDSAPLSMFEINIQLKPQDQWPQGMTWDKLIQKMDQAMVFPGMANIWWMPIQTRIEMLTTGIRSPLGIKVFGSDLNMIQQITTEIEQALKTDSRIQPYTRNAFAEQATGGYFIDFDIDRVKAARFGLNVADVESVITTGIGGKVVSQTVEGRERYNILVRYERSYRDHLQALQRTLVNTSNESQIPISQVADIQFRTGPATIYSENAQLVNTITINVADDIGIIDYVEKAKEVISNSVSIPIGYHLVWAGQFEHYTHAKKSLVLLVPLTLAIIFFMLYLHRKSLIETSIIMMILPFSLLGSISMLVWLHYKLSVAIVIGMIASAGLAIELGMLMMLYLNISYQNYRDKGKLNNWTDLIDAIVDGAAKRLRPKLMTGFALFIGLVPIMYTEGTGSEVMQRIAAPMIGGVIVSFLTVLVVFPAIFSIWKGQEIKNSVKNS
ncbi:efflux RND transporter permease subunit [Candidatus Nitrosacidococcus tergens]|uniref:Copper/silver efflux system, membrane component n=1 Tax=Candidatus Nitrosacidococcus tergens TaxID=553981 RepID=A0A7G1Q8L9_9GAMM|nr:CusA/CzcA family heavy metal efflux RND transporter [Candidatus Nitrosacidococcus tergens]CAB1275321.1 copper/silver efflux system, membrane component [Candidatus Nitrosacidococcus tergens]